MKFYKFNSFKFTIFLTIIESFLTIYLMSSFSKLVVNTVDTLIRNSLILLLLFAINKFILYMRAYSTQVSSYYIRNNLYYRITNHYKSIKYNEFKEKSVGERTSFYLNDVSQILMYTLQSIIDVFSHLTIIAFALASLFLINKYLFVVVSGLLLVMVFFPKLFNKRLSKYIAASQADREKFLGNITDIFNGYKQFVTNFALPKFSNKLEKELDIYAKAMTDVEIFAGKMSASLGFVSNAVTLISVALTSYFVILGKLPVGTLLSVIMIVPLMSDSSQMLFIRYTFYKSGRELYKSKFADLEEVFLPKFTRPIFVRKNKIEDIKISETNTRVDSIKTKALIINYPNKDINIKDISFEKGKKYLIVGDSASGKSSLLKAILGLVDSYTGEIYINGKLKAKDETLYDKISYVTQDIFLFKDSIKENISLANDNADVRNLLDLVALKDIDENTIVLEGGSNFSGGQKQKLSLARALARNKDIIFLDEATANLDKENAIFIENLLLDTDKTVVMISHKINEEVLDKVDEIIDLSK